MATCLIRETKWYLPFTVYIGERRCELSKICFFNANGVFAITSGWFDTYESKKADIITLDTDCVMKRKEDFSLKTAFVMSNGKDPYGDHEVTYTLYIPADILDLDYREDIESNPTHAFDLKRTWTSKVNPLIKITNYEYADCGVSKALDALKSALDDVRRDVSATTDDDTFDAMIKKLLSTYNDMKFARTELSTKLFNRISA